jgi:prefoldin subunit 5
MKLTGGEKERMIKADLGIVKRQISLLESHLEYYRECIKTLDNMGFAIQRRITVNNDL